MQNRVNILISQIGSGGNKQKSQFDTNMLQLQYCQYYLSLNQNVLNIFSVSVHPSAVAIKPA